MSILSCLAAAEAVVVALSVVNTTGAAQQAARYCTHTFVVACVTKLVATLQSEKPGAPSQGVGLGRGGGGGQPISAGN
jgi:hypothetical protein